ncbi:MAG: hypothetical protein A2Z20_09370 [Bdellovibrionales bacterium RBG_16_40_8]|nr:MAG: hypothetical protein A2Z20_09370 [Bdellovibrionales bacterium RBG_16_40_8]
MIIVWLIMNLSKRNNTRPDFTPLRPEIPHEKRPKIINQPERRSIILDGVNPRDLRELSLIYCCEQCSYFSHSLKKCAMGFRFEKHTRENQLRLYDLTGKMALCRSQEID